MGSGLGSFGPTNTLKVVSGGHQRRLFFFGVLEHRGQCQAAQLGAMRVLQVSMRGEKAQRVPAFVLGSPADSLVTTSHWSWGPTRAPVYRALVGARSRESTVGQAFASHVSYPGSIPGFP